MKKVFWIDGGAGRVIAAIPALLKYARRADDDWAVIVAGWESLYWGIPELQDRTYGVDTKGLFDNVVSKVDKIVTPEPYRVPGYFRQQLSLVEAFDVEINETDDHSDLPPPVLVLNKGETAISTQTISELKKIHQKQKTIVIQPFGRGAAVNLQNDQGQPLDIQDEESRSLSSETYLALAKKLSLKYNLIFFGEPQFQMPADTYAGHYSCDLRQWASLIKEADYFVGVDSVGQHMARSVGTPGTVIIGSTFPINTTYTDYFQVIEKPGLRKYSPIRIAGFDATLSNRLNEGLMNFDDKEINEIFKKISDDIERKTK